MRIKDMITQDTMSSYFNNFSLLGNVQGQQMGIWIFISWLKGLKPKYSLQCRRIFGGRKLLVYVRTVVTAIFVMTEED